MSKAARTSASGGGEYGEVSKMGPLLVETGKLLEAESLSIQNSDYGILTT